MILRVSRLDQDTHHITNLELRQRWGDIGTMSDHLRQRRLQWLGHVARMPDDRVVKQILFGWLPQSRPAHGPRLRWKDRVVSDLRQVAVSTSNWYALAQDRQKWREVMWTAPEPPATESSVTCEICQRRFKSSSGLARHKCVAVRSLPVQDQPGARQCSACQRWFRSAGGLAVHRCSSRSEPSTTAVRQASATANSRVPDTTKDCCSLHCDSCDRCFRSAAGFNRHNCHRGHRPAVDRSSFEYACACGCCFRRQQDLSRHKCKR